MSICSGAPELQAQGAQGAQDIHFQGERKHMVSDARTVCALHCGSGEKEETLTSEAAGEALRGEGL